MITNQSQKADNQEDREMAHYKSYLRYNAYEALQGCFPMNSVIFYYKGYGVTKFDFDKIDVERGIIL